MGVKSDVEAAVAGLEDALGAVDPVCLTTSDAAELFDLFVRGERLCSAGKTLTARRVADGDQWRKAGERSSAHWLARRTGTSIGSAAATLETARRLENLPTVRDAVRTAQLSEAQTREIASAAAAAPDAQKELLEVAAREGFAGLRQACRRVAAAAADEASRHQAIHRGRHLRAWGDDDGAGRLAASMTPEDLAEVLAGLEPFEAEVFAAARAEGRREPYEAYSADALVLMARAARRTARLAGGDDDGDGDGDGKRDRHWDGGNGGKGRAPATVRVVVNHAALLRGYALAGETCEIAGVGPVAVATVRAMMPDAFVAAVVSDGVDVYTVAHLGRAVTAYQRTALEVRDPECVVPGCHVSRHLEIDHVAPWAASRITKLDQLARLCKFHHGKKTFEGYRLEGTPGHWRWLPPEHPTRPDHPPPKSAGAGAPCHMTTRAANQGGADRVQPSSSTRLGPVMVARAVRQEKEN